MKFFQLSRLRILLLPCIGFLAPLAGHAEEGKVFLPEEGKAVSVQGFPGYALKRQGRDIFLAGGGKNRLVGKIGDIDPSLGSRWPQALVYDLDFDGVPEFLLLEKASDKDSVYYLVHFRHGQKQQNYLFSDRLHFRFADPVFDRAKRVITSRTSDGYVRSYAYTAPKKKDDARYRCIEDELQATTPSARRKAVSDFFEPYRVFFVRGRWPPVQGDIPLSFMAGALPEDAAVRGSQNIAGSGRRVTPDGRWMYVGDNTSDHAPRGWMPTRHLFMELTEAAELRIPSAMTAVTGCEGTLPAGSLVQPLAHSDDFPGDDFPGAPRILVRNHCSLIGWVEERIVRRPD